MTLSINSVFGMKNEEINGKKRSAKADRRKREREANKAREQRALERRRNEFNKACTYARDLNF